MRRITILPIVLAFLAPAVAFGQANEPGITKSQGDAILNELRQIRQLLEKQQAKAPAPQRPDGGGPAALKVGNVEWLGDKNAPLTIVEFTDYQCTFCQRFHAVTFPEIKQKYIDTGKVRFLSRDFPLDFHANAFKAAEAARCAGEQGKFWPMRDRMVADPSHLAESDLLAHATALGLKIDPFKACLASGKFKGAIEKEMAEATALNVQGTPTFIVGRSTADGVDGTMVVGALPYAAFEAKLKEFESK